MGSKHSKPEREKQSKFKIVFVGDPGAGKTCFIEALNTGVFPEEFIPTISDMFEKELEYDGENITISTLDTFGQEDYSRLRPLCYPDTDLFILTTSVYRGYWHKEGHFWSIKRIWNPELKHHVPTAGILLLGLKSDLREDPKILEEEENESVLKDYDECVKIAKEIGAIGFLECSSLTGDGFSRVVEEICQYLILRRDGKERSIASTMSENIKLKALGNKTGCLLVTSSSP